MDHDAVVIAEEPIGSDGARVLLAALDAHLGALYPPEANFLVVADGDVTGDRGAFLVARSRGSGGEAVGCGAVRLIEPATAEVKRMYVVPAWRGRGVGWRILAALEDWAVRAGCTRLVLETGDLQPDANRLYERAGFVRVPCFGEYADAPASVCYEKRLALRPPPHTRS